MIDFELFEKTINILRTQEVNDQKLQELIGDGIGTYSCDIVGVCVELLRFSFGDEYAWIDWWLWECDYGQRNAVYWPKGKDPENDEGVDISSIKDFYEFLTNLQNEEDN